MDGRIRPNRKLKISENLLEGMKLPKRKRGNFLDSRSDLRRRTNLNSFFKKRKRRVEGWNQENRFWK
ncbi:hypothetical protein A0128_14680 [Leptospira tipperaryensis]|uniref:Uncharacterized protein n=1 Tax=Leptospira tipperaryensis TaxID=2564040 RepID=A0A1D7UZI3_9LEPT|nr:hypothetical protein A0128_14680 [Leptospira tipperaryensis]